MEAPVFATGECCLRPTAMMYRNLCSMDVEEICRANPVDGMVLLVGCDKVRKRNKSSQYLITSNEILIFPFLFPSSFNLHHKRHHASLPNGGMRHQLTHHCRLRRPHAQWSSSGQDHWLWNINMELLAQNVSDNNTIEANHRQRKELVVEAAATIVVEEEEVESYAQFLVKPIYPKSRVPSKPMYVL